MREAEMADLKKQVDDIAHDIKNYDPLKDVRTDVEAIGKDIESSVAAPAPAAEPPARSHGATGGQQPSSAPPQDRSRLKRRSHRRRRICRPPRPRQGAREPPSSPPRPLRSRAAASPPTEAPTRTATRRAAMSREDEEKEIEATKAPLMDHLIELRGRLIKALAAFASRRRLLLLLRQANL